MSNQTKIGLKVEDLVRRSFLGRRNFSEVGSEGDPAILIPNKDGVESSRPAPSATLNTILKANQTFYCLKIGLRQFDFLLN